MKHTLIDLFSGAGGLTTGFHLAGFTSLCAVEVDSKAVATYRHNYPNAHIINDDIRQVSPTDLRSHLGLKKGELTAIIGGPPCQGFSRNVPAESRSLQDSRNQLYRVFLEFVDEFLPTHVVMENVPEILKAYDGVIKCEILEHLENKGYHAVAESVNAAYYGVPQTRKRAFFLASRQRNFIQLPKPTHCGDIKSDYRNPAKKCNQLNLLSSGVLPIVTVEDAIGDLPEVHAGETYSGSSYPFPANTNYQRRIRQGSVKITNHVARSLSAIQMARAEALMEGQDARDLPTELAPKKHYSGAYGRLYWDKPARTITRWVFHPGSGRFFHPEQNRTITIREAARLHSYPDTFEFLGSYTCMSSQIGESVPPLLGKLMADTLLSEAIL